MSQLDPHGLAMHRLHRDATRANGRRVKDLSPQPQREEGRARRRRRARRDAQPRTSSASARAPDARTRTTRSCSISSVPHIDREGGRRRRAQGARRARSLARRRPLSLSLFLSSHHARAHPALFTHDSPLPPFPFRSCSIPRFARRDSILRRYRADVDAIRHGQDAVRAKGIGGFVRNAPRRPTRRRRPRCAARS